jgi:leader peptidase (prepilin peptidase) / N-methyltransferase
MTQFYPVLVAPFAGALLGIAVAPLLARVGEPPPTVLGRLASGLAVVAMALWVVETASDPARAWADCVLGWALLALTWVDWRTFLLPDVLTLPLIAAGILVTWRFEPAALIDHAIGAALGYICVLALSFAYRACRSVDGIGRGDAKLMAAAGAWVGWQPLPALLFGASVGGLALALMNRSRRLDGRLPFGPCIAAALFLVRLYRL